MLDPILIDTASFTAEGGTLSGTLLLADLDARVSAHELLADADALLQYRIQGGRDRWQRPFLALAVSGSLNLRCQRCLQPVAHPLDEQAHVVLFADEAALDEAMATDDGLEGMLLTEQTDVLTLLEDQILMAMPFAPRHEHCDNPALSRVNQDRPNPFAQLAQLKK